MSSIRFGVYALSLALMCVAPLLGRTTPALVLIALACITGLSASWNAAHD